MHRGFFVAAACFGVVTAALCAAALRRPLLAVAAALALIGASFGLLVAWHTWSGPSPDDVARERAPLYDELPTFPGAVRGPVRAQREPPDGDMFAEGYLNPPPCCDTWRVDILHGSETAVAVAAFYRRAAVERGWRVTDDARLDDGTIQLVARRDRAQLLVQVQPPRVSVNVLPAG